MKEAKRTIKQIDKEIKEFKEQLSYLYWYERDGKYTQLKLKLRAINMEIAEYESEHRNDAYNNTKEAREQIKVLTAEKENRRINKSIPIPFEVQEWYEEKKALLIVNKQKGKVCHNRLGTIEY